jgi:nicotinate phosphoribosyltransferase
MKLSQDKVTLPGRKQVYRFKDAEGKFEKDVIALANEKTAGTPLMVKVMEKGKITYDLPSLNEIRETAAENLSCLPDKYKKVTGAAEYPVELSQDLEKMMKNLKKKLLKTEVSGSS